MPPSDTTWIHVFDDAVKIGLGATIAGFFAWLVACNNAKSSIQKLVFERKSKILSDAAQTYEAFFQAFLKYSGHLCGIAEAAKTKLDPSLKMVCDSFLADRFVEAVNLRLRMKEQMEASFTAQSLLMLLGEDQCRAKAEAFYRAIMAADTSYQFDGRSFSLERFEPANEVVREARITFYREMQEAFKKV